MRRFGSDVNQDYYTMTLAAYRVFDRSYPGEWIDNADVFEAVATELDLDVCETVVIDGKPTNLAEYRFRWTQQALKHDGLIERDASGPMTARWRLIQEQA